MHFYGSTEKKIKPKIKQNEKKPLTKLVDKEGNNGVKTTR